MFTQVSSRFLLRPALLAVFAINTFSQQVQNDSTLTYEQLLDQVLPLKDPQRETLGDISSVPISVVIRARPSFSPEWRMILRFSRSGISAKYDESAEFLWRRYSAPVSTRTKTSTQLKVTEKLLPPKVAEPLTSSLWEALRAT